MNIYFTVLAAGTSRVKAQAGLVFGESFLVSFHFVLTWQKGLGSFQGSKGTNSIYEASLLMT